MIIYKLTSISGKSYIGLSKNTLKDRWNQHRSLWRKNIRKEISHRNSGCPKLYYAFDKYDPYEKSNWTHEILFETKDRDILCEKEIEFIQLYDTIENGYNIMKGGQECLSGLILDEQHKNGIRQGQLAFWSSEAGLKLKKERSEMYKGNTYGSGKIPWNKNMSYKPNHTDEGRKKMSEASKGKILLKETREKISKANLGRKLSPEHIEKTRQGRLGKTQTDYQKQAVSDALSKMWEVTFPDGHTEIIKSLNKFCKHHGLNNSNLQNTSVHVNRKSQGFKCRKLDD